MDPYLAETGQPYTYAGDDPVNESDPSGNLPVIGGVGETLAYAENCYDVGGLCIPSQEQGGALQAGFEQYAPKYKQAFGLDGWGPFEQFQVLYSMCGYGSGYDELCSGTLKTALTEAWLGLPGMTSRQGALVGAAGCPTTDDAIEGPGPPEGDPEEEGEAAEIGTVNADERVEEAIDPAAAGEDGSLQAVLNSNDRTFSRYLTSLQSQAATGNSTLTPEKAQIIWDAAQARGWSAITGVDSDWVGGSHFNVLPAAGEGGLDTGSPIHFPVPDGWEPDLTGP
jgi:hypothetical protein